LNVWEGQNLGQTNSKPLFTMLDHTAAVKVKINKRLWAGVHGKRMSWLAEVVHKIKL
jgi:hypothetical protein